MADPALALQAALVARLKADAALAAIVSGRVYDEPPQGAVYPLVQLGNIDVYPFRTDGRQAWRIVFSIEAHSRPKAGRVEATQMACAVVASLDEQHASIPVTGFTFSWLEFVMQTVGGAQDGKSRVAVTAFEAVLDA